MGAGYAVLQASIGGSFELLALTGTGALLSHLGHFTASISAALSNAIYKVFLPALCFDSILHTIHHARTASGNGIQDVWVPLVAAVSIFFVTSTLGYPLTVILAREKEEIVRRVMWTCIVLGNSNTMALLVMQSICDSFDPLKEPTCAIRSAGYASLYITIVTVFTWTVIFPYLRDAPDAALGEATEDEPFLSNGNSPDSQTTSTKHRLRFSEQLKLGLLSPPTVAVLLSASLGLVPGVPSMFVSAHGTLRPILLSIEQVAMVAIPISSMIVGAELHRALTEPNRSPSGTVEKTHSSQKFGVMAIGVILLFRMIVLPMIGRLFHRTLGLSTRISDPLLSAFTLVEWTVPTANNCIIMVSIVAERLPVLGARLRRDVSTCLFWQYVALPLFLTVNTMLGLKLQFPNSE